MRQVVPAMPAPGTRSAVRYHTGQWEFRASPRVGVGARNRRWTRRSNCSTPDAPFTPTKCSKTRGRPPARRLTLDCGKASRNSLSGIPTSYAGTGQAPTGCYGVLRQRLRTMPMLTPMTSTCGACVPGPKTRKTERCHPCKAHGRASHRVALPAASSKGASRTVAGKTTRSGRSETRRFSMGSWATGQRRALGAYSGALSARQSGQLIMCGRPSVPV